jgi:hypothetical protein
MYSERPIAILDTNVIYPLISRDLLFWFAYYDLFIPKWSAHIFEEWVNVMLSKGISQETADKRTEAVTKAFPTAMVMNYEKYIPVIHLPDKNDRHTEGAWV